MTPRWSSEVTISNIWSEIITGDVLFRLIERLASRIILYIMNPINGIITDRQCTMITKLGANMSFDQERYHLVPGGYGWEKSCCKYQSKKIPPSIVICPWITLDSVPGYEWEHAYCLACAVTRYTHQLMKPRPCTIYTPVMKRASGVTRNETKLETSWVVPRSPTDDNRLNWRKFVKTSVSLSWAESVLPHRKRHYIQLIQPTQRLHGIKF
jgi:hypothetical protein